jgi:hypothetical protein
MKSKLLLLGTLVLCHTQSIADNHAGTEPTWSMGAPVEIYGCSFKEGVDGYKQSQKFAAGWNEWANENEVFEGYVAQMMWPEFSDGQYATDFTWLGYWANYEDAGRDMDIRARNGAPMYAQSDTFLEQCAHSEWGAWDVFSAGNWTKEHHVTEFADCFYLEGKGDADLLSANIAYASELESHGITAADFGSVQLWPRAGAPTGTVNVASFKWVRGYPNLSAYTGFTHKLWNEGLGSAWNTLYGEVVSCDSSRVYHSEVIRSP